MQFRYLQDVKPGFPLKKKEYVYDNLEWFLNGLEKFNLKITDTASYKLKQYKKDALDHLPENHILTKEEAENLNNLMLELRPTFYAESQNLFAYILSDKRFTIEKLISGVSTLFPPEIFNLLTNHAKMDLEEAGKCIAVQRPTAAAFHILRATESILRDFYKKTVSRNRIKNDLWGNIVADLRSKKNGPPKTLLDNLDNIRSNFRNPTQHPDMFYNIEEVQDLFSLCIDVITRMIKYTKTKNPR